MILKDPDKLRLLFAQQKIYKQVEIASLLEMSENSVVRLFKQLPVYGGTARRIAKLVNTDVGDLFEVESRDSSRPKELAGTHMMGLIPA